MASLDKNSQAESDDSDDDYVPNEKGNASEEENSGDEESELEEDDDAPKSKRRKSDKEEEETEKKGDKKDKPDIDVDALWSDFKQESEPAKKPITIQTPPAVPAAAHSSTIGLKPGTQPPKAGGGLAGVLGKIGKKDKVSMLEKSRLDWNSFKKAEGIEEDLQTHNRGKDGFLEKRDFLERTDLRQFEIEKAMRSVKRSNR